MSKAVRQRLLERLATACPGPELCSVLWNAEVLARRRRVRPGNARVLDEIAAEALLDTLLALAARRTLEREAELRPTPSALLASAEVV